MSSELYDIQSEQYAVEMEATESPSDAVALLTGRRLRLERR